MKKKYSIRILSILNIVEIASSIIMYYGITLYMPECIPTLAVSKQTINKMFLNVIDILAILFLIVNVFSVVINVKNKKLILWSIAPIVMWLSSTLSIFEINIIPDDIYIKLWAIIPAIMFLIACILEIRNDKRIRNIIFYILATIMSCVMFFFDTYNTYIWFFVSCTMQFIYSRNVIETSKIKEVIFTILLCLVGTVTMYTSVQQLRTVINVHMADMEIVQLANEIKTKLYDEKETEDSLILVSRDNKWGYINENGKEVIPCEYDAISTMILDNINIIVAQKDDTYNIISKNGNILVEYKGDPLPYFKEKYLGETIVEVGENEKNIVMNSVQKILASVIQPSFGGSNNPYYEKFKILEPNNEEQGIGGKPIYEYNLKNGDKLCFEQYDKIGYRGKYDIQIKRNGMIIESMKDIITSLEYTDEGGYLDGTTLTYLSGDIPFCNPEKQISGYYDVSEMSFKVLNGKYRILEVKDNKILIRDYNNIENTKDYIMNLDTGEILYTSKEIAAYQYGYIVLKDNGKYVYLDNELNEKISEFDYMMMLHINNGVVICGNNNRDDTRTYTLYDYLGKKLTTYIYQSMLYESNSTEITGTEKKYIFDYEYEDYYYPVDYDEE